MVSVLVSVVALKGRDYSDTQRSRSFVPIVLKRRHKTKEVFVIEKSEFIGLSVLIAESIIEYSKKFYGFKMVSRDTNRELSDDGMIGVLSPAIRKAFKEMGIGK